MKTVLFYLSTVLILASCASSRFIEPLAKGEQVIGLDIGGPTIEFGGAIIPIPLSSVVYARGIDTNITVFGSLHITSLLFGNIQTDLGATYRFFESKNSFLPSLSSSVNANAIYDMNDSKFKFWPQLDLNAYWKFGEKDHYVYAGISNWWELAKFRSQERPQLDRWLVNPQIGLILKSKKWWYSIETKFLAPSHNNVNLFVPYFSFLGENGASGIYFGIGRKF